MENKRQHLQMIQDVITRMASNSFLIKGWAVTGLGALFALWIKENNYQILYLILAVSLIFWGYDAYYLWLEHRYRDLYEEVAKLPENQIDFSMETSNPKKEKVTCVAITTPILFSTYGLITFATFILLFINKK
ncbi:MAG: hypothetical protein LBI13_02975 [Streptococcaceae bacterium]|jgi:hypothetical protein|nr:hypothetical protein [Streptococcaceae bacterium]